MTDIEAQPERRVSKLDAAFEVEAPVETAPQQAVVDACVAMCECGWRFVVTLLQVDHGAAVRTAADALDRHRCGLRP